MKVIIAGSRSIRNVYAVDEAMFRSGFHITEVVSGHAGGVDQVGELLAERDDLATMIFPANWDKYGRSAGIRRNAEMADYADAAVVVWDGESRGSKNMIEQMEKRDKPVFVWRV